MTKPLQKAGANALAPPITSALAAQTSGSKSATCSASRAEHNGHGVLIKQTFYNGNPSEKEETAKTVKDVTIKDVTETPGPSIARNCK